MAPQHYGKVVLLKMNQLSLRHNWLKFKTLGNATIILEEYMEYTLE